MIDRDLSSKVTDFKDCLSLVLLGSCSHCLGIIANEIQRKTEQKNWDRSLLINLEPRDPAVLDSQTFKLWETKVSLSVHMSLNCVPATHNKSILTKRPLEWFLGIEGQESWGCLQGSFTMRNYTKEKQDSINWR